MLVYTLMNLFVLIALAVGLAMDSFAVAIATGVALVNVSTRQAFRMAFHFGLFHVIMLLLGWFVGLNLEKWISKWDHWLVFCLLGFIGIKMIYQSVMQKNEEGLMNDPTKGALLVMLSVATSLDALGIGLSFALMEISIWFPVFVIGIVIIAFTIIGLFIGGRFGARFGKRMEIIGGLILIIIGFKILLEHIM